jgi:hypothetical protein
MIYLGGFYTYTIGGEHACFDFDALVAGVTKAEIQRMPPAHRQRLAQVLRYIADLADPARCAPRLDFLVSIHARVRAGDPP